MINTLIESTRCLSNLRFFRSDCVYSLCSFRNILFFFFQNYFFMFAVIANFLHRLNKADCIRSFFSKHIFFIFITVDELSFSTRFRVWSLFNKSTVSSNLNSYRISCDESSVVTFWKLFIIVWTKNNNLMKFLHSFFINANFKAIFKIWFIFFDWSFFWKWYAVMNKKAVFKWLNVIFQKTATNFLFRLNRIVRDRLHFFFEMN